MEQTQQNMKWSKGPLMAAVAGIGGALVVATLPHVYLENIVGATGLSELVPAAAPPLGNTARGLIAIMAGLVSASAIYFFLNRKRGSDMGVALREQINAASPIEPELEETAKAKKSLFSLPKFDSKSLTKFLKKPKKDKARVMDLTDLPQLRKIGDESEEAERPPLFTEPETGSPLPEAIKAFEEPAPVETAAPAEPVELAEPVEPAEPAEPIAVEQPAVAEPISEIVPPIAAAPEAEPPAAPAPVIDAPTEDLSDLNIAQLADRLEAGLRRLKQLEIASAAAADMPLEWPADSAPAQPAEPAAPVAAPVSEAPVAPPVLKEVEKSADDIAAARQADMDAALKAALGTLEKMTAHR